jgi:hypothetical protein
MDAKKIISEGKIEEAIVLIEKDFENKGQSIDDLLLIKGRYYDYKNKVTRNQISHENASIEKAKITQALFEVLENKASSAQNRLVGKNKKNTSLMKVMFLIIFVSVSSFFIGDYFYSGETDIPSKDDDVTDLVLGDFNKIYPKYRDIYLGGTDNNISDVRLASKEIISKLKIIDNDHLQLHSIIYKNIGIALCYKILALTSLGNKNKIKYSSLMLEYLSNVEEKINSIEKIPDIQYKKDLNDWIIEEQHLTRLKINKFIASAINVKANGSISKESVRIQLERLDADLLLEEEGYNRYPIVKWARKNLK